jgi:hypothetical protein
MTGCKIPFEGRHDLLQISVRKLAIVGIECPKKTGLPIAFQARYETFVGATGEQLESLDSCPLHGPLPTRPPPPCNRVPAKRFEPLPILRAVYVVR